MATEFQTPWQRTAEARLAAASCSPPSFVYSPQSSLWGEREIIGFGRDAFAVKEMERGAANEIVRANHYSRTTYNNSLIHLGVYAPNLLGVLQFGQAMNPQSQAGVVAGTLPDEYLELNRMWLADALPRNSESQAISYSLTYIRRKFPKIAWVQSFADERCGRHGVVYQACNFIYCGEHTSVFWELDGEMYHNSAMTRDPNGEGAGNRPKVLQENKARAVPHKLRQFRYIYFLKRGFRQRLNLTEKAYPKHASEGSMESRPDTIREGGGQFPDDAPISRNAKAENDQALPQGGAKKGNNEH